MAVRRGSVLVIYRGEWNRYVPSFIFNIHTKILLHKNGVFHIKSGHKSRTTKNRYFRQDKLFFRWADLNLTNLILPRINFFILWLPTCNVFEREMIALVWANRWCLLCCVLLICNKCNKPNCPLHWTDNNNNTIPKTLRNKTIDTVSLPLNFKSKLCLNWKWYQL